MKLARRDADLGSESVAEPVRETGRAVAVDTGGVDKHHEPVRRSVVFRYDAVRMMRAEAVDMRCGLLHAVDQPDGEDHVQILLTEVRILHDIFCADPGGVAFGAVRHAARLAGRFQDSGRFCGPSELNTVFGKRLCCFGKK